MSSSVSGTITASAQTITLGSLADPDILVEVSGTYTDVELVFEASTDGGSTFFPYTMNNWGKQEIGLNATGILSSVTTSYQRSRMDSIDTFRVRSIAHSVGTMDVTITADETTRTVEVGNIVTVSDDTTRGIDVDGVQQWEADWVGGNSTLLWDTDLTGSATATDNTTESAREISVTTASGDKVIVQARQRQLYLLGRTKRIILGALMGAAQTDTRKRIGFFDDDDGMFFEQDGTGLKVVTRTSTGGSASDTAVAQASWNLDPLDGSGTSGLTLDVTRINTWVIDFDWTGGGKVKFGLRIGGIIKFVHEVAFDNTETLAWLTGATLPVRFEMENTGVVAGAATMKLYSASVVNFSGLESLFIERVADNTASGTSIDTTLTPLVSIRLSSSFIKHLLRLRSVNIFTGSGNTVRWAMVFNGSLTAPSWTSVGTASIAEFDISATDITGGTEIQSGFFDNNNGVLTGAGFFNLLFLSADIASTADIITLAAQRDTGTATVHASMRFEEYKR